MNELVIIGEATKKRIKSFEFTDGLPPELRQCVHEYGYAIVQACFLHGVRTPKAIHMLVHEIWSGARQPTQRGDAEGTLDWLLMQSGATINAATLCRVLNNYNLLIVPREPTRAMIEASKNEVSGFNERITKTEKHKRRLTAALAAATKVFRQKLNEAA